MAISACTNCGSKRLYQNAGELRAFQNAPFNLAGLLPWYKMPQYDVVICSDCGLSRIFVGQAERDALRNAKNWRPVTG